MAKFTGHVDPVKGTLSFETNSVADARDGLAQRSLGLSQVPVDQDGIPNSGSVDTVEMVTVSTGSHSECARDNSFCGQVRLKSFFTGRKICGAFVEFTIVAPATGNTAFGDSPSGFGLSDTYGLWSYGNISVGGSSARTWKFDDYTGTAFTFSARVMGNLVASDNSCETTCDDGADNDNDGKIDCADEDCVANTACASELCGNGFDDDGDGSVDCDDGDCVGDATACSDVDECSEGLHNCDPNATCTNSPGGFSCACNAGYEGDGTNCVPALPDCAVGVGFRVLLDDEVIHAGCTDAANLAVKSLQPWLHTDSKFQAQSSDFKIDNISVTDPCGLSFAEDFATGMADWSILHKGGMGSISVIDGELVLTSDYNEVRHNVVGDPIGTRGLVLELDFYRGARSAGLFVRPESSMALLALRPDKIWGGKGADWTEPDVAVFGDRVAMPNVAVGWHHVRVEIADPEDSASCEATPPTPDPNGECWAIDFDGSNDYVSIPNAAALNPGTGDFTIEAWIKPAVATGALLSKRSGENYYIMYVSGDSNTSGFVDVWFVTSAGWVQYGISGNHIANEWAHVAFQRKAGTASTYVNGRSVPLQTTVHWGSGNPSDHNISNTGPLQIARQPAGSYYRGGVAEVRVTNAAVYDGDFVPVSRLPTLPETVVLLHFDEGANTTLADDSGTQNNGTLSAGTWVQDGVACCDCQWSFGPATVPATAGWMDSGVAIEVGDSVSFAATGLAASARGEPLYIDPDGNPWVASTSAGTLAPSLQRYALIGKVGSGGTPFLVGSSSALSMPASGTLFFAFNDEATAFGDNSGAFTVTGTIQ